MFCLLFILSGNRKWTDDNLITFANKKNNY